MLGNTQTARTPEKGTSEVGLTFGATTYQFETLVYDEDSDSFEEETVNVVYPVMLPEIPFGVAVTDDVSIGGRVAPQSLGLEGNVKVRFLHADRLHMAVQPAFNYQAWLLVQGVGARLPLLVTYDMSDNFSFTTSVHTAYTNWSFADDEFEPEDAEDTDNGQTAWNGGILSFGMGAGIEIRGESFFLRPTFEFNRYQSNFDDDFEDSFEAFNSFGFMLNIGFVIGRTKKQLDRIEKKIDNLQPQPAPAPTPPPAPQEQASALSPDRRWWLATTPGAVGPDTNPSGP